MGGYSRAGDVKMRKVEEMGGAMRKTRQESTSFQSSKFFYCIFYCLEHQQTRVPRAAVPPFSVLRCHLCTDREMHKSFASPGGF